MSEVPQSPSNAEQIRDDLLADVTFNHDFDASALRYDAQSGGLVVPVDEQRERLVMFRSHRIQPSPEHTLAEAAPPLDVRTHTHSVFGSGYYLGNSVPAVELFAWTNANREIGVYQTPPLTLEQVIDIREGGKRRARQAKQLARLVFSSLPGRGGVQRTATYDEQYGEIELVTMDVNPFTYIAHKIQAESSQHPIEPVWYLWRGSGEEIERIGTVDQFTGRKRFFQSLHDTAAAYKKSP